jgi:hypothetical protein
MSQYRQGELIAPETCSPNRDPGQSALARTAARAQADDIQKQFRSPNEFLPHAEWLMDTSRPLADHSTVYLPSSLPSLRGLTPVRMHIQQQLRGRCGEESPGLACCRWTRQRDAKATARVESRGGRPI